MKKIITDLINRRIADPDKRKTVLRQVAKLQSRGHRFEEGAASLELLIMRKQEGNGLPFRVTGYHVSIRRNVLSWACEATVKVRCGKIIKHEVSEGTGPVNALDKAIRLALSDDFRKQLSKVKLKNYSVTNIGDLGTMSKTVVTIVSSDGKTEWSTTGVSENVIEASLQALTDSFEYALLAVK